MKRKYVIPQVCIVLMAIMAVFIKPSTFNANAASMELSSESEVVKKGKTLQLKVNGSKSKVKWSSNKKSIARVDNKGKVKAINFGLATITANVNGKKLKCRVAVTGKKGNKISIYSYRYNIDGNFRAYLKKIGVKFTRYSSYGRKEMDEMHLLMTKSQQKKAFQYIINERDRFVTEKIAEMGYLKSVTYNKAMTKIDVVVDKEAYLARSEEDYTTSWIYSYVRIYQIFQGIDGWMDVKCLINIIDKDTGEIFEFEE